MNLVIGNNIRIANWIIYIFNLQGFQIYVHRTEHLCYITIIMVCYLITQILNLIDGTNINKNMNKYTSL